VITSSRTSTMKVIETKPNELVRWTWRPRRRRVDEHGAQLSARYKQDQTFILFTHANWKKPSEFMHHWQHEVAVFLLSLKALVETVKAARLPMMCRSTSAVGA